MTNLRLAARSLRHRPAAFVVVLVVGLLAPILITGAGSMLTAALIEKAPPATFTAPIVVAGPAGFRLPDQQHQAVAYPEGSTVDPQVEAAVRAVAGVGHVTRYTGAPDGRLVALGVHPQHGVDVDALTERLERATGDVRVLTGDARGRAEDPGIGAARVPMIVLGGVSAGITLAIVALVAASALSLVIGERSGELRLFRLVGATPRQLRRMLVVETTLAAALSAAVGSVLAWRLTAQAVKALKHAGLLPELLEPAGQRLTAAAAAVLTVVVLTATASVIAGTAVRKALDEPPPALGPVRNAGLRWQLAAAVGGTALLMLLATPFLGADAGGSVGGPAVLVAGVAVAIAAPMLVTLGLPLFRRVVARVGLGGLSADEVAARPGRIGSVLAMLSLGVALAIANLSSAYSAADAQDPQVVSARAYVETDEPVTAQRLDVVASTVEGDVSATAESVGWLEDPYDGKGSDPLPLVGVDHAETFVGSRLDHGDLGDLTGDSIAVTSADADKLHLGVGDSVGFRFGDGATRRLRVVAILAGGKAHLARVVSYDLLRQHVRTPTTSVVVDTDRGTAYVEAALRRINVGGTVSAHRTGTESPFADLGGLIYLVVAIASLSFATLVAVNSVIALTLSRRKELWAWRLVGASRRQLRTALLVEGGYLAVVSVATGLLVGGLAAVSIALSGGQLPSLLPIGALAIPAAPALAILAATRVAGARATKLADA